MRSERSTQTAEVTRRLVPLALTAVTLAAVAGCGGSKTTTPPVTSPVSTTSLAPPTTSTGAVTTSPATRSPGPLQAEANSAAAGDIPDNQVFLLFRNRGARYAMKYPEGWAQQGSARQVTFRDKNNIVRVVIESGARLSARAVRADVARLTGATVESAPRTLTLAARPAFAVTYTTESRPNPVTGKRVVLVVDRYYLWKGGRIAVVDLGTPVGVDNVDAYRLMIESFRWS